MCHLDEAGFAMTLPTGYSWSPVGERLLVPYQAPEGRRVNAIGAYFSHGPLAGAFHFACFAKLPARGAKRKTLAERAERHGVSAEAVGSIDSERFLAFVWKVAGRPEGAGPDWRRERELWIALDNYSIHTSAAVQAELPVLAAAGVHFWFLPSYSPELSDIEPIWHSVKYHDLPQRSFALLGDLMRTVTVALTEKAVALRAAHRKPDHLLPLAA